MSLPIISVINTKDKAEKEVKVAVQRVLPWDVFVKDVGTKLGLVEVRKMVDSKKRRITSLDQIKDRMKLFVTGRTQKEIDDAIAAEKEAERLAKEAEEEERRRQIEEERKFMQWLRNRCHIISLTDHEEWFTYEPGVGNKNVVVTGWNMEEEEKERKFAELKKGDIVMEIEGERVLNEPTEDILKKLQEAKRPLSIRFLKAELEYARSIAADFIIREKLKKLQMTPLERLYYPGKDQALKDYAVLDLVRQRQFDVSDSDLTEEDAKELANDEGDTLLHLAAASNNIEVMDHVIELGADINDLNYSEVTPLHFAVARDNPRAMLRLLLAGASPYREDGMGMDALSTAVKSQSYRCLPFLLKCGPALLRAASTTGYTPLHHAALRGDDKLVSVLLRLGANPYAESKGGDTPLLVAKDQYQPLVTRVLSAFMDEGPARSLYTLGWRKPALWQVPVEWRRFEGNAVDIGTEKTLLKPLKEKSMDFHGLDDSDDEGDGDGSIGSAVAQVHWDFMERMPQIWVGRSIAAEESWAMMRGFSLVVSVCTDVNKNKLLSRGHATWLDPKVAQRRELMKKKEEEREAKRREAATAKQRGKQEEQKSATAPPVPVKYSEEEVLKDLGSCSEWGVPKHEPKRPEHFVVELTVTEGQEKATQQLIRQLPRLRSVVSEALKGTSPASRSADWCQSKPPEAAVPNRVLFHCEDGVSHCIPVLLAYITTEIPQTCKTTAMLEVFRRSIPLVAQRWHLLAPWTQPLKVIHEGVLARELRKRNRAFQAMRLSSLAGL